MAELSKEEEQRIEEELDDEWEDEGQETPGAILLRKFGEIRRRILIVLGTMVIFMIIVLTQAQRVFAFLLQPLCSAIPEGAVPPPIPGAVATQVGKCMLYPTDLLEPMVVLFKMSLLVGLFAAAPVLFFQLFKAASPYISKTAKGWTIVAVISATLFFVGGAVFGFFFVFPRAFAFLLTVAGPDVIPLPTMASYFSIVSMLLLGFGVSFELPLLMFLLSKLGVTNTAFYARYQRHAAFGLLVFAAVITPTPDPITMLSLAIPLLGLYYLGLGLSWFAGSSGPTLLEKRMKEMDMLFEDDEDEDGEEEAEDGSG